MPRGKVRPEVYILLEKGLKPVEIAKLLNCNIITVYRYAVRLRMAKRMLEKRGIISPKGDVEKKKIVICPHCLHKFEPEKVSITCPNCKHRFSVMVDEWRS